LFVVKIQSGVPSLPALIPKLNTFPFFIACSNSLCSTEKSYTPATGFKSLHNSRINTPVLFGLAQVLGIVSSYAPPSAHSRFPLSPTNTAGDPPAQPAAVVSPNPLSSGLNVNTPEGAKLAGPVRLSVEKGSRAVHIAGYPPAPPTATTESVRVNPSQRTVSPDLAKVTWGEHVPSGFARTVKVRGCPHVAAAKRAVLVKIILTVASVHPLAVQVAFFKRSVQ